MKLLSHESGTLRRPLHAEIPARKRRYYRPLELAEELNRNRKPRVLHPRIAVMSLFGMVNRVLS